MRIEPTIDGQVIIRLEDDRTIVLYTSEVKTAQRLSDFFKDDDALFLQAMQGLLKVRVT